MACRPQACRPESQQRRLLHLASSLRNLGTSAAAEQQPRRDQDFLAPESTANRGQRFQVRIKSRPILHRRRRAAVCHACMMMHAAPCFLLCPPLSPCSLLKSMCSQVSRAVNATWGDGLRPYFQYRDLGIKEATSGQLCGSVTADLHPIITSQLMCCPYFDWPLLPQPGAATARARVCIPRWTHRDGQAYDWLASARARFSNGDGPPRVDAVCLRW